jgi:DNA-binding transcriptional LysR family regulator
LLNLNQLRVFHEVAKAGSFTAAATAMGVSQPAISMQVKHLQESIGIALYRIDGHDLVLTDFGLQLISYAERIFSVASEAEQHINRLKTQRAKSITITTTRTIATYLLPRVIQAFKALHNNLDIRLELSTSDQAFESVLSGRSDFALVVDAPKHPLLQRKTLLVDELILIAADDKSFDRRILTLDFTRTVLILREQGSKTRQAAERALQESKSKIGQILDLADVEAIKNSVRAGVGVSIIPSLSAQDEIGTGVLSARPFLDGSIKLTFDAVYRKGESSPISRALLRALSQPQPAEGVKLRAGMARANPKHIRASSTRRSRRGD